MELADFWFEFGSRDLDLVRVILLVDRRAEQTLQLVGNLDHYALTAWIGGVWNSSPRAGLGVDREP